MKTLQQQLEMMMKMMMTKEQAPNLIDDEASAL
jgi:hypothetical protein